MEEIFQKIVTNKQSQGITWKESSNTNKTWPFYPYSGGKCPRTNPNSYIKENKLE